MRHLAIPCKIVTIRTNASDSPPMTPPRRIAQRVDDPDITGDVRVVAIKAVAGRQWNARHNDSIAINGSRREREAGQQLPPEWTEAELAKFDRLRRRMVA